MITLIGIHKDHAIAAEPSAHGGWYALTRHSSESKWQRSHIIANDLEDAEKLARQIIDYGNKVCLWEILERRKYDPFTDGLLV